MYFLFQSLKQDDPPAFTINMKIIVCVFVILASSCIAKLVKITHWGRAKRNKCDPKWTNLYYNHTMCLNDVGIEVVINETTKAKVLQRHNNIRSEVKPPAANMLKLIWDEELALVAGKWARQCFKGHDRAKMRAVPSLPGHKIGQNIAAGQDSLISAVNTWNKGVKDAGDMANKVLNKNYARMINARLQRVGCGQAYCQNTHSHFYVCNYDDDYHGYRNYFYEEPYKHSATSCSDCPSFCDASGTLCDCGGKVCQHGGTVNVTACTCSCHSIYIGDRCQTVNCQTKDPDHCGTTWTVGYCKVFSYARSSCPRLCGLC